MTHTGKKAVTTGRSIHRALIQKLDALSFAEPVTHVYNPLEYAQTAFERYLSLYGHGPKEVLLVGMNPGPWGMAQTGIPFGDVGLVRDWLQICAEVGAPKTMHPKRPVAGWDCPRGEVSGQRLWGWAANAYPNPQDFFKRFFVLNHCPLVFMEESGRNRTPDKLPVDEREPLLAACDEALARWIGFFAPRWVVGIGAYAQNRLRAILAGSLGKEIASHTGEPVQCGKILHPSPASPMANRGWAKQADADLKKLGIGFGAATPVSHRDP